MDPISSGLSMLSMGLSVFASLEQGKARAARDEYQSQEAQNAAVAGQVKAAQTSTALHQNLMNVLGNIQAVRSAAGTEGSSPTGAAISSNTNALGQQDINRRVGDILTQSREEQDAANFYKQLASNALLGGELNAASGFLNGISNMASSAMMLP